MGVRRREGVSIVVTRTYRRRCMSVVLSAVRTTTGIHKANVTGHARRCITRGVGRKGTIVTLRNGGFTNFDCVRS